MKNLSNFKKLSINDLELVEGGKKSTLKCYTGTLGSAVLGFGAMGPLGYWAGAGVGYATFC